MKYAKQHYTVALVVFALGLVILPRVGFTKPIKNQPSPEKLKFIQEQKQKAEQSGDVKPDFKTKPELAETLPDKFDSGNFTERVNKHEALLEQRLNKLDQFKGLPEDKRAFLEEHFQEEMSWLKDARSRLQAATTTEERKTIQAEIRDHAQTVQTERRQELAQTVDLPVESPVERAQTITNHFNDIITKLESANVDVTTSQALFDDYEAAVANLDAAHSTVLSEKNVENIQNLKTAIEAVRSSSLALRNQLRSILMSQLN